MDEPILRETFPQEEIRLLGESFAQPENAGARAQGATNLRNIAKLKAAGARFVLGTDTGGVSGGQYFGLGSHIELELLVRRAGLVPMQAVIAGTRNAARVLRLDQLGTLAPGKGADFLVLDANPLDDIGNTRRIANVYLRGEEIPRAAMVTRWRSALRSPASTR